MSFQDVSNQQRRQHPIFDSHRQLSDGNSSPSINTMMQVHPTPPSSISNTRRQQQPHDRKSGGTRTPSSTRSSHGGGSNPNGSSPLFFNFGCGVNSKSKDHASLFSTSTTSAPRGVRPRLSTSCPVTSKNLLRVSLGVGGVGGGMDDQASLGTQDTVDTYSSQEESENPAVLPIRSRSSSSLSLHPPSKHQQPKRSSPQSVFAHLTTSIVNFQKMVVELERLSDDAGSSPEIQWRTRILMRSAQEADRDIHGQLTQLWAERRQPSTPSSSSSRSNHVALRKLQRDYDRCHNAQMLIRHQYEQRQSVEVSLLNTNNETREEFFDKAMREREAEVLQIHKSMHQVNAIYQDLAAMVDGQQEQIDKIAEGTKDAKSNTRAGLESVQFGLFGLCGPSTVDDDNNNNGGGDGNDIIVVDGKDNIPNEIRDLTGRDLKHSNIRHNNMGEEEPKEEGYRVNEHFQWSMPFETLGEDVRSVQADVWRFGRDLVEDLQEQVHGQLIESSTPCTSGTIFDCHDQTEQVVFCQQARSKPSTSSSI